MSTRTTTPYVAPTARGAQRLGIARLLMKWLTDWLPALPLLLLTFGMLVAPAVALIIQSVTADEGSFTLVHWVTTLNSAADQRAIFTSLRLGATCATISLIFGGPIAYLLTRMVSAKRAAWLAALNVAANFGGIGLAFGYVATLGTLGMVTLLLQQIGLPFKPPAPSSFWGLALAYEYTNIPLFVLLTIPTMAMLRPEWREAAEASAATPLQYWRMVGLPILAPFLGASWLLIFTWSVGLYGLPFALGGASTAGQIRLITLQIGIGLQAAFGGPQRVAVLAVLLMILATISLVLYRIVVRRALRWFV